MDEHVCLLIVAGCVIALALALSFTGTKNTDASAVQASPVTGIFALLMGLFPFGVGVCTLGGSFTTLMGPKPASPTPTAHDIVPFILIVCLVTAGVYFLAAANTFYRPQTAWRLHFVLAIPLAIFESLVLIMIVSLLFTGDLNTNGPRQWQDLLLMYPIFMAPFHCYFAFRDTWRVFRGPSFKVGKLP